MKTTQSFDREDPNHLPKYNVVAKSQDKGSPALDAKVTITVAIVDQNDEAPKFDKPRYEGNVPEDAAKGYNILELTATDADIGDNARLDYFVSSGDASQNFRMETVYGATNKGILLLDGKLDYETQQSYTIKVTATDRKDSATVDVVINVSNNRSLSTHANSPLVKSPSPTTENYSRFSGQVNSSNNEFKLNDLESILLHVRDLNLLNIIRDNHRISPYNITT